MSWQIRHAGALLVLSQMENHEQGIVWLISFFSCLSVRVSACASQPSILSDMFNRALAALTEGVNVSYFIRNPKEEG